MLERLRRGCAESLGRLEKGGPDAHQEHRVYDRLSHTEDRPEPPLSRKGNSAKGRSWSETSQDIGVSQSC